MKNKRVEYGFLLKFPPRPFSLQQLMKKYPKVQYITLYMRVKKALKNGELSEIGKLSVGGRRGRRQKLYHVTPVPVVPGDEMQDEEMKPERSVFPAGALETLKD